MMMKFLTAARGRLASVRVRTLGSREAYDLSADAYLPEPDNKLMHLEQATMLSVMPLLAGRNVLDLACGTGRFGTLAAGNGAASVVGVDVSYEMLRHARLRPVAQCDLSKTPFADGSFDVILCALAIGHCKDLRSAVCEIARLLTDQGTALVSDLHPKQMQSGAQRVLSNLAGEKVVVEHYVHSESDFRAAVDAAGLQLVESREAGTDASPDPAVIAYVMARGAGRLPTESAS